MNSVKRINLLNSEIQNVFHDLSVRMGLSDSTSSILYTIRNFGDACLLSQIISMTGLPKQTVNSALRKLEAEGILRLEQAEGRRKKVCLTDQGKRLADNTVDRMIRTEDEIFASWPKEELAMYLELTQRYLDQLKDKAKELQG